MVPLSRGSAPAESAPAQVIFTCAKRACGTHSEIADALHISLSTVKTHLASLMHKLDARNRVEVAMWAYETGRAQY